MIYVDTSVILAQLLAEDRKPPLSVWSEALVSSRLAEYETWVRLHALRVAGSHGEAARRLLGQVSFLELSPLVLARALEPFPRRVRTLDALHLASVEFLRAQRVKVRMATYDRQMVEAASSLRIPIEPLDTALP
ncbi:MAG: PIN domain-containing protein [Acidimicrobiia bacterium]